MTEPAPDLEHDLIDTLAPDDVDSITEAVQLVAASIATARLRGEDSPPVTLGDHTLNELGLPSRFEWDDLVTAAVEDLVAGVPDRERADRALLRVALIDRDVAEVRAVAQRQREQVDQWEADRVRALNARRPWHEGIALAYAAAMHRADPKMVTDKLPHGEVTCRKAQDKVEATDEEAFGVFAIKGKHTTAVRVKYEPVKAKLAEVFVQVGDRFHVRDTEDPSKPTDEVVPGVRVVVGANVPKVAKVHPLPPRV